MYTLCIRHSGRPKPIIPKQHEEHKDARSLCRLRSLDVALLTAGTRLRGDFEERLRFLLEDVDQEGSFK